MFCPWQTEFPHVSIPLSTATSVIFRTGRNPEPNKNNQKGVNLLGFPNSQVSQLEELELCKALGTRRLQRNKGRCFFLIGCCCCCWRFMEKDLDMDVYFFSFKCLSNDMAVCTQDVSEWNSLISLDIKQMKKVSVLRCQHTHGAISATSTMAALEAASIKIPPKKDVEGVDSYNICCKIKVLLINAWRMVLNDGTWWHLIAKAKIDWQGTLAIQVLIE